MYVSRSRNSVIMFNPAVKIAVTVVVSAFIAVPPWIGKVCGIYIKYQTTKAVMVNWLGFTIYLDCHHSLCLHTCDGD